MKEESKFLSFSKTHAMEQAIQTFSTSVLELQTAMPQLPLIEYPWPDLLRFSHLGITQGLECPNSGREALKPTAEGLFAILLVAMTLSLGIWIIFFWYLHRTWSAVEELRTYVKLLGEATMATTCTKGPSSEEAGSKSPSSAPALSSVQIPTRGVEKPNTSTESNEKGGANQEGGGELALLAMYPSLV